MNILLILFNLKWQKASELSDCILHKIGDTKIAAIAILL